MKKLCVIMPAYNEGKVIERVLEKVKTYVETLNAIKTVIVVVDDGSKDDTLVKATKAGVVTLHHTINRGLGGALATGFEYAKRHGFDIAITFDSDGQHDVEDILPGIKPILDNTADVVVGSRLLGQDGMPLDRKVINHASNLVTWLLVGLYTTDSQSGFRVFSRKALQLISPKTQGMEVSSEFFMEIKKHRLRLMEVPISVIYSPYSRKKGQSNLNSLNVTIKLFLRLFR